MKIHTVGVIMNGVTGRMGANQHLERSVLAIRRQGGVRLDDGAAILPEPLLVGRNENKLRELCARYGLKEYTTDLDAALSDERYSIYFDALTTRLRAPNVLKAIAAGKHVYVEKPTATSLDDALGLYRAACAAGVRHGVVQDKLWLPGILKLKYLLDHKLLGRLLAVRGEFGYWVFDGLRQPCQRPSWNYRREEGGSILIDMFCHWRYVIDNLFGPVKSLAALGATHVPRRADEQGRPYDCTADDAAYAIFEVEGGLPVQFNSSWCTRVRRDDLLVLQVDGTEGTAVAGLRECRVQFDAFTPKPVWNPDIEPAIDYDAHWEKMPNNAVYDNAFKAQWELFLKAVVEESPFCWDLLEGAKGVQLAELGLRAWHERRWVEVPELT
jgi:predicted dehydrogenase